MIEESYNKEKIITIGWSLNKPSRRIVFTTTVTPFYFQRRGFLRDVNRKSDVEKEMRAIGYTSFNVGLIGCSNFQYIFKFILFHPAPREKVTCLVKPVP